MSFELDQYAPYVWVSYAVFAAFLLWDFLMPYWRMRQIRQELRGRLRREAARAARKTGGTP